MKPRLHTRVKLMTDKLIQFLYESDEKEIDYRTIAMLNDSIPGGHVSMITKLVFEELMKRYKRSKKLREDFILELDIGKRGKPILKVIKRPLPTESS